MNTSVFVEAVKEIVLNVAAPKPLMGVTTGEATIPLPKLPRRAVIIVPTGIATRSVKPTVSFVLVALPTVELIEAVTDTGPPTVIGTAASTHSGDPSVLTDTLNVPAATGIVLILKVMLKTLPGRDENGPAAKSSRRTVNVWVATLKPSPLPAVVAKPAVQPFAGTAHVWVMPPQFTVLATVMTGFWLMPVAATCRFVVSIVGRNCVEPDRPNLMYTRS